MPVWVRLAEGSYGGDVCGSGLGRAGEGGGRADGAGAREDGRAEDIRCSGGVRVGVEMIWGGNFSSVMVCWFWRLSCIEPRFLICRIVTHPASAPAAEPA